MHERYWAILGIALQQKWQIQTFLLCLVDRAQGWNIQLDFNALRFGHEALDAIEPVGHGAHILLVEEVVDSSAFVVIDEVLQFDDR